MIEGISEKLGIKLEIGRQQINVNIPREMEEAYRRAGKQINQKLNLYATMYPQKEYEQLLCMVLIDIALSYQLSENKNDVEPYKDAMTKLTTEIEEMLGEKEEEVHNL